MSEHHSIEELPVTEEAMRGFRAEIEALQAEEQRHFDTGDRHGSLHLIPLRGSPGFTFDEYIKSTSPEEVAQDIGIWEKIKDGTLTREEIEAYKRAVRITKENTGSSRDILFQFFNNKAGPVVSQREVDAMSLQQPSPPHKSPGMPEDLESAS